MPKIFFDVHQDLLMINGNVCVDNFLEAKDNEVFGIIYTPSRQGYIPLVLKLCICAGKPVFDQHTKVTACGDNNYIVKFCPQSYGQLLPPKPYFQSSLNCAPPHFLTAYQQGDYFLSLETQQEIITLPTPCKLENITFKARNISRGNLIFLSADISSGKFLAILQYNGDYKLIFQATCDSFIFGHDGIQLIDKLDDMFAHTIYRSFAYEDGIYAEKARVFECRKSPRLIDELLPYAFIESLFCGDLDKCNSLCSLRLAQSKFSNIFGDFSGILSKTYLPYTPYRLALYYDKPNDNYIKYFDFSIIDGTIVDIYAI
ncbi:MAG: hypothetical protein RR348_00020 [Clostridia bacterium]